MDFILKLKHWQLFLIFLLPSYFIRLIGVIPIVVFELIGYSLWLYSIATYCYARNNKQLPVIFMASSILMPLLWIVSYLSIPLYSFAASVLWLIALAFNVFIVTKSIRVINPGNSLILIALSFLIPFIGVWYIQPLVNKKLNEVQA